MTAGLLALYLSAVVVRLLLYSVLIKDLITAHFCEVCGFIERQSNLAEPQTGCDAERCFNDRDFNRPPVHDCS